MKNSTCYGTDHVAEAYLADTGVFLRWFIDQQEFEHAREVRRDLIDDSVLLETLDFARVEVAGVLRKKGLLAGRLTGKNSPRLCAHR
jgi:hypothetical protein